MGYAAIYPEDVIAHHRAFIARRRTERPSEEYRDLTATEWDEFLAHFELRKVALGTCGRDFGTPCAHENACVRLTLTGTVTYGSERAAAELTVAGLTGVRNIKNDIQISNDADAVDVTLNVQDALDRYALIPDDSDVVVDTNGNTVTLSGQVRTWAEHDAAVDAAWMAVGVYDVRDDLYITG